MICKIKYQVSQEPIFSIAIQTIMKEAKKSRWLYNALYDLLQVHDNTTAWMSFRGNWFGFQPTKKGCPNSCLNRLKKSESFEQRRPWFQLNPLSGLAMMKVGWDVEAFGPLTICSPGLKTEEYETLNNDQVNMSDRQVWAFAAHLIRDNSSCFHRRAFQSHLKVTAFWVQIN